MTLWTPTNLIGFMTAFMSATLLFSTPTEKPTQPYIDENQWTYIQNVCESYDVSPYIIASMIYYESSWKSDAENGTCEGLMQISSKWHKDRMQKLNVTDLEVPEQNILIGTDYFNELIKEYKQPELALMKYNGTKNAEQLYRQGKITDYAKKVLETAEVFEKCYNSEIINEKTLKELKMKKDSVYLMNKEPVKHQRSVCY